MRHQPKVNAEACTSGSRKILAVAPSAKNRGLIVFELAESPPRDGPQRNAGSESYLLIAIRHGASRELATTWDEELRACHVGRGAAVSRTALDVRPDSRFAV
jgi:hypothetical protein